MSRPLDSVASIKVKLGVLVATAVVVAVALSLLGSAAGVPPLLVLPVSVALALGVTQLLAAGMVAPLRQMTGVAQRMARGDYTGRVRTLATDEVGQLAAAFNQMAADLATVDRERRELIATVSHELRTPLTAMTALLENLADGVVAADRDQLGQALEQARRLGALVTDLLELSRLEAGVTRLEQATLQPRILVEECVEQAIAAGRTGDFDVRVPRDLEVVGDPVRLRQLVGNTLDNAARHSPAGSSVRVTGGRSGAGWWLQVSDDGPGVAPNDRERVFERFGTDAVGGGTGLGLAVARWVAQLHGGTLRFVDPPSGRGARLRLEVPDAGALSSPARQVPMASTAEAGMPPHDEQAADNRPAASGPDGVFGRFWPETRPEAGLRTVLAAVVVGLLAGAVLSFAAVGLSWTLMLVAAGSAALLTARRRREPWTIACAGLALLLVLPTALLDAWWISGLGVVAAGAVFLCGVTAARSLAGILLTGLAWPLASLRGLPWFGRRLRVAGTGGRTPAVVRTVVFSLLALAVFGAIFASADALFASWVDRMVPSLGFEDVVVRGFVACAVFALTLAAAYLAANPAHVELWSGSRPTPLANRFEWLAPVLVVDAVFVAFLAAQAAAVFGGRAYVERTTGLTYADHVHQGFGQLTLATVLTLFVVWVAARRAGTTAADRWWLRGSLGMLCLLTLVVVTSALHGMSVYQDAYGFTTLRFFVDVFEGWLGFVVLAVMVAGAAGWGRWLTRVALVSGAVALVGLAAINPDAWVASRNIDRYKATRKLDIAYLQTLSDDATPVIARRLRPEVSRCVLQRLRYDSFAPQALDHVGEWNLGRHRAAEALRDLDLAELPEPGEDECAGIWEQFDG